MDRLILKVRHSGSLGRLSLLSNRHFSLREEEEEEEEEKNGTEVTRVIESQQLSLSLSLSVCLSLSRSEIKQLAVGRHNGVSLSLSNSSSFLLL